MKIAHVHVSDTKNKGDIAIVQSIQSLIRSTFEDVEIIDIPIESLKTNATWILDTINSCNLVVVGGGGVYCRYFLPFNKKLINKIKPPIVILGVGYGNEIGAKQLSKKEINSILHLMDKSSLSSVRDSTTLNFLNQHGHTKKVHLITDPAIHLNELATDIDIVGMSVGFNINYSGWLGFGQFQDKIISSYRQCIDSLKNDYGASVYYLVHHPSEYEILPKLDRDIYVIDLSASQQKYFYSQLNLVIGMMLHVGILTFGAGTPLINVAYDIKNTAFADHIGHSNLSLHPNDLEPGVLLEAMKNVLNNQEFYRDQFRAKKDEYSQDMASFLSEMKSYAIVN